MKLQVILRQRRETNSDTAEFTSPRSRKGVLGVYPSSFQVILETLETACLCTALSVQALVAYRHYTSSASQVAISRADSSQIQYSMAPPQPNLHSYGVFTSATWCTTPLLLAAVVFGALLRRIQLARGHTAGDGAILSGRGREAVILNLERQAVRIRDIAQEIQRVGTRLRLTRREIKPRLQQAEGILTDQTEAIILMDRRMAYLESEMTGLQHSMGMLQEVSANQLQVLSSGLLKLQGEVTAVNASLTGIEPYQRTAAATLAEPAMAIRLDDQTAAAAVDSDEAAAVIDANIDATKPEGTNVAVPTGNDAKPDATQMPFSANDNAPAVTEDNTRGSLHPNVISDAKSPNNKTTGDNADDKSTLEEVRSMNALLDEIQSSLKDEGQAMQSDDSTQTVSLDTAMAETASDDSLEGPRNDDVTK